MSWTRLVNTAVVVVVVVASFVGKASPQCANYSSACGDLRNIRSPFRLKGDPRNCGENKYELECENNRALVHLYSGKYYVVAINYNNYTIRLVDVGIHLGNCSSLPLYYLSPHNFSTSDPYTIPGTSRLNNSIPDLLLYDLYDLSVAVWVDCEKAVKSNSLFTDTNRTTTASTCIKKPTPSSSSSSVSSGERHSYFVFGSLRFKDVAVQCRIDEIIIYMLTLGGENHERNASYLDFHSKLAYGFELSWVNTLCDSCEGPGGCFNDQEYTLTCLKYYDHKFKMSFLRALENFWNNFCVHPLIITGWILVGRTSCGILCLFTFLIYKFRRRHLSMSDTIEGFLQSQNNLMPIRYSYLDIMIMTKGLMEKLGEGGYGSVYKGTLRSGFAAAVKVLGKSKANGQEFINEVATIGRIHHVNVVRLVGFCATTFKRALVYEFMPNGSLEKYIFSQEGNTSLSCKQMYEISLGVARGIDYLHRGCEMQILHFDIKPHNILLDENFNPKVSDFGLAKLYPTNNSIVSLTAARGTMGYMAPELFYKNIGRVSYKADVYSFGMLLMEMAGRRRNLNLDALADHPSQIYFPSWVYDQFKEGKGIEMVEATEEERQMVKKMVITALWCIQMKPSDRPSMNKVVDMLEGNVEVLEMPPKPFLTPQEMPAEVQ